MVCEGAGAEEGEEQPWWLTYPQGRQASSVEDAIDITVSCAFHAFHSSPM